MHEGGCLCGGVRYSVNCYPTDVIVCHCRFCQRSTGSAAMQETLFPMESLQVTCGKTKTYTHISEGSGKSIFVNFCENCGTKLYLTFERFPTIVGVYSGTFDDPDWYSRTPENTQYFFLKNAPIGTMIPAGFEVFHEHYWQSEGIPAKTQVFDAHTVVTPEIRLASEEFANSTKSESDN